VANTHRLPLDILATQVVADITYMPVLLSRANFPDSAFDPTNSKRITAANTRVYQNDDQTNELAFEVVSITPDSALGAGDGECQIWISGAGWLLSSLVDTRFYVEYGSSLLSAYAAGDLYGRFNVYRPNRICSLHLEQDPSGGAPQMIDSSGSGNHYTSNGGMASNDLIAGKIGNGLEFDGVNDYLTINSALAHKSTGYSIQMWVNVPNFQDNLRLYGEGSSSSNTPLFTLGTEADGLGPELSAYIRGDNSFVSANRIKSTLPVFDGTDHLLTWVDNNGIVNVYIDGILDATDFNYTPTPLTLDSSSISALVRSSPVAFLAGAVSEFSIYNEVLSAPEIATSYNNQNNPSAFISTGAAESIGEQSETLESLVFTVLTNNLGFDFSQSVTIESSGFTVLGNDLDFDLSQSVTLEPAGFAVLGNDLGFNFSQTAALESSGFEVLGNDLGFDFSQSAALESSGFSVLSNDLGFNVRQSVALESTGFTLLGSDLGFNLSQSVTLESSGFTVLGNDLNFSSNQFLALESSDFTVLSNDLDFDLSPALTIESSGFAVLGNDLDFDLRPIFTLESSGFTVLGNDLGFNLSQTLTLESSGFTVLENDLGFDLSQSLTLESSSYSVSASDIFAGLSGVVGYLVRIRHEESVIRIRPER